MKSRRARRPGGFVFFFRVVSCGFVDKFFPPAYIELTLKHHGLHQSAIRIPQSAMRLVLFSPETFIILSPPETSRARLANRVRAPRHQTRNNERSPDPTS